MSQHEKRQEIIDLLEEKILYLRMTKVTQTDALAIFKAEKDIKAAEAERDKIKQEIENQNTSATSGELYQALLKLGYREQVLLFKKFLKGQAIATFLVHGSPDYGQRWLLNRLITQHIRHGTTDKLVRIQLNRIGRRRNISALWRELGGRVGKVGKQPIPSEIVEQVYKWWQTQNVILVFHDVDCMPQEYLQQLIQEFWLPLATQARKVVSSKPKYQLMMFLVDYIGDIGTKNTLFVEKLEPNWEPRIPIKLPPIIPFGDRTLNDWMETIEIEFDTLPLVEAINNTEDEIIREILENSENGVPELVMSEICHLCECNWYEEKDRWLKY